MFMLQSLSTSAFVPTSTPCLTPSFSNKIQSIKQLFSENNANKTQK